MLISMGQIDNSSMEKLIASHRAAVDDVGRRRDDVDDRELSAAVGVETSAMRTLLEAPCRGDEEFFTKTAYVLAENTRTAGAPDPDNGFGALAIAVAARLSERAP
jgi:hypothetical protein